MNHKVLALSAFILLAACAQNQEMDVTPVTQGEELVFSASFMPETRSHFIGDTPALAWDASDKLLVYSVWAHAYPDIVPPMSNEELASNVVSAICPIDILDTDPSQATVHTGKPLEDWLYSTNPSEYDVYLFFAYYPVQEVKPVYMEFGDVPPGEDEPEIKYFIDHEIPSVQDGKSYNEYQLSANIFDEDEPLLLMRGEFNAGDRPSFDRFAPLNSMLKIKLSASSGPVSVKKLVLHTTEADHQQGWRLSGACRHNLMASYLELNDATLENTSSFITLEFDEPLTLSSTPSDWIYVVTLPHDGLERDDSFTLVYDAYDADDNLVLSTQKTSPAGGFKAGKRYILSLDMT